MWIYLFLNMSLIKPLDCMEPRKNLDHRHFVWQALWVVKGEKLWVISVHEHRACWTNPSKISTVWSFLRSTQWQICWGKTQEVDLFMVLWLGFKVKVQISIEEETNRSRTAATDWLHSGVPWKVSLRGGLVWFGFRLGTMSQSPL